MARLGSSRPERSSQTSRHRHDGTSQFKCYMFLWFLSTLCYANSLTGEFVFDDHEVIETNLDIRPNSPFMSIFKHDFWGDSIHSNTSHKSYRPVTIITFRWNFLFGGLDPKWYHLVNIFLHGAVTVLFASTCEVLLTGLTSSNNSILLAGSLFAVHPIHTEAVTSIVGRADLLSAFFYLLSFSSYTRCVVVKNAGPCGTRPASHLWTWIIISIVFGVLSMLSKEQGVTVMAVCAVYDVLYVTSIEPKDFMFILSNPLVVFKSLKLWPKWVRRLVERLAVLMLSCVALLYLRIVVIGGGVPKTFVESDNPTFFNPDVWTRFRTYAYLCAFNAWLLLCPSTLCFDWSMDSIARIETFSDTRNLATFCFVIIFGLFVFKGFKSYSSDHTDDKEIAVANGNTRSRDMNKNITENITKARHLKNNCDQRKSSSDVLVGRTMFQGLCMFIVPFIPASNLFFPVGFVVAERVLYIPSMGFCILVALGIYAAFGKDIKKQDEDDKQQDASSLLTFGLSMKGWSLFYALLVLFATKTLHRNTEWQDDGSLAASGLKVNPSNAKIHLCMGNYFARKGLRSCEGHYREALRLRPHYTLAWVNLGLVLLNTDRPEEAEYCYTMALSINPNSANANTNMANLLRLAKRYEQAETRYRKALSLRANDPMLFFNLGLVLEKLRKTQEAKKKYLQSIALMPSHSKAYFAVARIMMESIKDEPADSTSLKTLATAEEYLRLGLRYDQNDIQARLLSARILLIRGNQARAKSELLFVLLRDQHNIEARYLNGLVMERDGKLDDAERLYHSILQESNHTKTIHALERLKYKRKPGRQQR